MCVGSYKKQEEDVKTKEKKKTDFKTSGVVMDEALEHDEADGSVAECKKKVAKRQLAEDAAEHEVQRETGTNCHTEQRLTRRAVRGSGEMSSETDCLQSSKSVQKIQMLSPKTTYHWCEHLQRSHCAEVAVVHQCAAQQTLDDCKRQQFKAHVSIIDLVGAHVGVGNVW